MNGQPENCNGCALCCLFHPVPPFSEGAMLDLRIDFQAEIKNYRESPWYRDTDPCLWLDRRTGTCKHYDVRPRTCREFELCGTRCLRLRADRPEPFGPGKVMRCPT